MCKWHNIFWVILGIYFSAVTAFGCNDLYETNVLEYYYLCKHCDVEVILDPYQEGTNDQETNVQIESPVFREDIRSFDWMQSGDDS